MPRPTNPFILHIVLAIVCLAMVMLILPGETALWRRVVAGILSIGLGFHLATALLYSGNSKAARIKTWIDGLAFPMLIGAFQLVPETNGWVLLVAGILWRHLVARVIPSP